MSTSLLSLQARRSRRKDKYNEKKENEGQTTVREPRGKLVDELLDHPPRTSSCRDNLQKPVAPRRQGSWPFDYWGPWPPSLFVH